MKDVDGWNIGDVNVISSTEKPLEVTGTLEQTNGEKKMLGSVLAWMGVTCQLA